MNLMHCAKSRQLPANFGLAVPPKRNQRDKTLKQSQLNLKGGFPVHTAESLRQEATKARQVLHIQ